MSRPSRKPLGAVPPPRPATRIPPPHPIAKAPGGDPMLHAPLPHVARPPQEHRAGKPPNPRRPKLVRDADGVQLNDLFKIFADLPRPARPPARAPIRRGVLRRAPRRA